MYVWVCLCVNMRVHVYVYVFIQPPGSNLKQSAPLLKNTIATTDNVFNVRGL